MILTETKDVLALANRLRETKHFVSFDTETDGVEPFHGNKICGVPVRICGESTSYYVPFRHKRGKNADEKLIKPLLSFLEDETKSVLMWNAPFDVHMSRNEGVDTKCKIIDVQLGAHLRNENETGEGKFFALKPLADKYVDPNASAMEKELEMKIGGKSNIHLADPRDVDAYACQDTDLTWEMFLNVYDDLKEQGLVRIFDELSDYVAMTIDMEREGVMIDKDEVLKARVALGPAHAKYLEETRGLAGDLSFNPNSPPQCRKLFGLKDGESCDKDYLESLGTDLAVHVMRCRQYTKIDGSFYEPFLKYADVNDRIHPNIKLHGTVSGRPSCTHPNLQALPREGDFFNVRSMVVAPEGWSIISHDWSQIELRLLAHYTKDENLMKAFFENIDIHQVTADLIGIGRDPSKQLNFGAAYGLGVPGFAKKSGLPEKQARVMLNKFHSKYPTIRRLARAAEDRARSQGYIGMWTGRRKRYVESWEFRKAMSGLIQGGVAEIMRVSMIKLYHRFKDNPNVRFFLQVHDDILAYARDEFVPEIARAIREIMTDFDFRVPIEAETKVGKSWGTLKKVSY